MSPKKQVLISPTAEVWTGIRNQPLYNRKRRDSMGPVFQTTTPVCKVDERLGLVFGFAIVCHEEGVPYFDVQGDHIPEHAMLKAASDFMAQSRMAKEMHVGDGTGEVLFAFPLTEDIAKALDITTKRTGLLIGMKPAPEVVAKFKDGTYTGFSIGGEYVKNVEAK